MNDTNTLMKQFKHQFYRSNKGNLFLGLVSMLLLACGNLAVSWLLQQIIDIAAGVPGSFTLLQLTYISILITVGLILSLILQYHTTPRFIKKALEQYKNFAFRNLTNKGIHSFTAENTSSYVSALSNDVTSIETNYLSKLFPVAQELFLFIGALVLMIYYSPLLTLIAFLLSLFPVIASLLTGDRLSVQEKVVSDQNGRLIDTLKDMLSGFSVIKSFKSEREALSLYAKRNAEVEESKCKSRKIRILIEIFGTIAGVIAQFGVFLFGAYLASTGTTITAGVVLIFLQLMNYVLSPISSVPQILASRKASMALLEKMASAITSNVRTEGTVVCSKLDKAIEVKNLSFGYDEENPVLEDIHMRFEAGKSYAIVGGSGSGKSTLLNLLSGGFEGYNGEILFDDNELHSIHSDSLYNLVSMVQQNVFIFNNTVSHNITMFHDFPEEKLNKAIHMAGLDTLIHERGMEYPCGENGTGLSGGERQRISIARCLLRNSSVMLVDEATASLDTETAFSITNSILDLSDMTRIIVTHRLEEALLQRYDQIYVLKEGRLNECGTFEELMKKKGYFYSLYTIAQ